MASFNPRLYEECVRLLIEARKAAGVSQQQLAERIGRRQTFISKIELRERRLDPAEFILIGRAIGADPLKLLLEATEGVSNRGWKMREHWRELAASNFSTRTSSST